MIATPGLAPRDADSALYASRSNPWRASSWARKLSSFPVATAWPSWFGAKIGVVAYPRAASMLGWTTRTSSTQRCLRKVPSPLADDVGAQVHHDVDGGGELADRELAGDLRALLHGAGDELLDGVLGAAGVGGADRARAGLHGLEHVPDLRAADLADDLAGEVEPEGVVDGLLEAELTGLAAVDADLAGSGPVLPGVDDLVPVDAARAGAARTRSRRCRSSPRAGCTSTGRGPRWSCPMPWTPETTMLLPARTQAARKSASTAPHALRS